MILAIALYVLA